MTAYKYSRRNYRPLLFLLALGGVGLTSWGTWRSRQPTMQIPLAPKGIRPALSTRESWHLSGAQLQVYGRWQQYLRSRERPQFSADGRYVAVALGLSLHLYSTETGKLVARCELPPAKPLPNTIFPSPQLKMHSAYGENAWYVWHEGQGERAQVYRLTPESWNAKEPLTGFTSVGLISPDARFVFGYGQKGERRGWDRKTGKVVNFSGKLVIYWEAARIDPNSGAVYGPFRSVNGGPQKRAVFLDPETGKELTAPAYLQDKTLATFRLSPQGAVTGHQDGTITVRPRSLPEANTLTYKTKLHSLHWVALAGERWIWTGGLVPAAGKAGASRVAVECIDREGDKGKLFVQPDFTDDERGGEAQWGEVIEHWGRTRLYVLGRTLYEKRSSVRHEAWIGDTTNGKQVRVPWDVPAVSMVLSPQEDFAAWIDKSGTLNLWRVPL